MMCVESKYQRHIGLVAVLNTLASLYILNLYVKKKYEKDKCTKGC